MDLELNSEGGSGGPTSICSDQLFDACGAEPVLDLPHGAWLAGRSLALARSRSSASVSGPGKVRVEVRKLHQYVWAGQRHPSRRPGSSRCGTVASRGDGTSSRRAPRCRISRGASRCCPQAVAVAAWAEDVEPAAPVDAIDRAQPPGAAEPAARRSGRRPAVTPVWCAGCWSLSWVSTVMSRSEVSVAAADK
jgi:hypothetical protein